MSLHFEGCDSYENRYATPRQAKEPSDPLLWREAVGGKLYWMDWLVLTGAVAAIIGAFYLEFFWRMS